MSLEINPDFEKWALEYYDGGLEPDAKDILDAMSAMSFAPFELQEAFKAGAELYESKITTLLSVIEKLKVIYKVNQKEIEYIKSLEIYDFSSMPNYQTQVRNAVHRIKTEIEPLENELDELGFYDAPKTKAECEKIMEGVK